MRSIAIYDSQGYPLDASSESKNDIISDLSRFGVLFSIEFTEQIKLITYFRGYKSETGRMEQFYARANLRDISNLQEIHQTVTQAAEEEYNVTVEESKTGENIFSSLKDISSTPLRLDMNQQRINYLLSQGQQLRFGVRSYEDAIQLLTQIGRTKPGLRTAITEGASTFNGPLKNYDLVVETGSYYGVEPLGDTEDLMDPRPEDPPGFLAEIIGANERTRWILAVESLLITVVIMIVIVNIYLIASQFLPFLPGPSIPSIPSLPGIPELPWI